MGKMVYAGVDVETKRLDDGMTHVTRITLNGDDIDKNKQYAVAVLDMFTLGRLFPIIRDAEVKEYFMPEFLRDLLAWKLAQ